MSVRKASHAGSWYSDSGNYGIFSLFLCLKNEMTLKIFVYQLAKELGRQLDGWLDAANFSHGPARAIIAP